MEFLDTACGKTLTVRSMRRNRYDWVYLQS